MIDRKASPITALAINTHKIAPLHIGGTGRDFL
jgi:hypothetical protein